MDKAILVNVTLDGLKILDNWDIEYLNRLTKGYGGTCIKPLHLVDFETEIVFTTFENMKGDLVIMQDRKKRL